MRMPSSSVDHTNNVSCIYDGDNRPSSGGFVPQHRSALEKEVDDFGAHMVRFPNSSVIYGGKPPTDRGYAAVRDSSDAVCTYRAGRSLIADGMALGSLFADTFALNGRCGRLNDSLGSGDGVARLGSDVATECDKPRFDRLSGGCCA